MLFPSSDLRLSPEELRMTLLYHARRARAHRFVDVDSEASPARVLAFCCSTPGHYISDGHTIIKENS